MPRNKDLKRLVRARMRKTGEAYTAARAQLLRKRSSRNGMSAAPAGVTVSRAAKHAAVASKAKPNEFAAIAGMSDATIKEKTGCTWERWVYALDRHGAAEMPHREIADLVSKKYKIDGWWSQTVTVGYERIKGLRARGQRRDGSYEASKSRTYNVPVATLFDAWADAKTRKLWLSDAGVRVRAASAPKSLRLGMGDKSIVALWFTPKGESNSVVSVQHGKLPDRETADRFKEYWSQRLGALGSVLAKR